MSTGQVTLRGVPVARRHGPSLHLPSRGRHRAGVLASWALLLGVLGLGLALVVVPKATGSVPLTVLTGSMRPTYPPGSVLVVRPTPAEELRIGDAITYQARSGDPALVTHRVVAIILGTDGSRSFVTQGDANDAPDPAPVVAGQVRGRVWYAVPYLGRVTTWLTAPRRELATGVVAGGLLGYGAVLVLTGLRPSRAKHRRS